MKARLPVAYMSGGLNDKKIDRVYEEVKRDVVIQIMAVMLCYLKQRYRYTPKTLNSIRDGMSDLLKMMCKDGIMGKPFTTQSCIDYLYSIGIDLEKKE